MEKYTKPLVDVLIFDRDQDVILTSGEQDIEVGAGWDPLWGTTWGPNN